ncbi:MAG TPA: hypothetical protein PKA58_24545 [Polyangium sp.]|nr:hypothetical protein [Polyangium sp.]
MTTHICAIIGAGMSMVIGLPACSRIPMSAPRSSGHQTPAVQQASDAKPEPVMTPLVLGDETSKSLPVEQDEEPAEACSDALYIEEPMASGYVRVSEPLWLLCNKQLAKCGKACRRRRSEDAKRKCFIACNAEYMLCLQATGLTTTFAALDKAWEWINAHKTAIVGTIVIVGGIAYLVSTSGAGALILVPLGA